MIIYFDCISGVSGDMLVSSLIDAGVDFQIIKDNISQLNLDVDINVKDVDVNGIKAKKFNVILQNHHHHHHRKFQIIKEMIINSKLNDNIKSLSIKIFEKIASAEAKIHGSEIDDVRFHEVGADDSIVDIVAFATCIDYLKPEEIIFSKLFDGKGFTNSMHGIIPVPAPAVLEIAHQNNIPIGVRNIDEELITPTGIGIAAAVANRFEDMPLLTLNSIGYGAGSKSLKIPNCLRAIIGEKKN